MDTSRILVYDCEISTPIITDQSQWEDYPHPFARSFTDFERMRISVLCAFPLSLCLESQDSEKLYQQGMWFHPETLGNAEYYFRQFSCHVGFNSIAFDYNLLQANGVFLEREKQYDILAEYYKATRKRVKMSDLAGANLLNVNKNGHGGNAPLDWIAGKKKEVTLYCAQDVLVTALLMDRVLDSGQLQNPHTGAMVKIEGPGKGLF